MKTIKCELKKGGGGGANVLFTNAGSLVFKNIHEPF